MPMWEMTLLLLVMHISDGENARSGNTGRQQSSVAQPGLHDWKTCYNDFKKKNNDSNFQLSWDTSYRRFCAHRLCTLPLVWRTVMRKAYTASFAAACLSPTAGIACDLWQQAYDNFCSCPISIINQCCDESEHSHNTVHGFSTTTASVKWNQHPECPVRVWSKQIKESSI